MGSLKFTIHKKCRRVFCTGKSPLPSDNQVQPSYHCRTRPKENYPARVVASAINSCQVLRGIPVLVGANKCCVVPFPIYAESKFRLSINIPYCIVLKHSPDKIKLMQWHTHYFCSHTTSSSLGHVARADISQYQTQRRAS